MNNLPKPISNYIDRYNSMFDKLFSNEINEENLSELIIYNKALLNNLILSGLGASTLLLRLGAVIQLCKKLKMGTPKDDQLLIKQILENLNDNLPSDTSWKVILTVCSGIESEWNEFLARSKGQLSVFEKFISFRNKFIHGYINRDITDIKLLRSSLENLNFLINNVSKLFFETKIDLMENRFFFIDKKGKTPLFPFLQKGSEDGLPYIFQGLYDQKSSLEMINIFYGNTQKNKNTSDFDSIFLPMQKMIKETGSQIFDHSNRIQYYQECFVGRETESKEVLKWIFSEDQCNILPIYSDAGMGKGALTANIINEVLENEIQIPVLYHFCGSGIQNSLHAVINHLILQGNKQQVWKTDDQEIIKKLKRLPSKYEDSITFFQRLLEQVFVPTRKNTLGILLVVIDGLDEASVSYPQFNISDWFNLYDENGEVIGAWESDLKIKWIFTFRDGFYKFPSWDKNKKIDIIQPLQGLTEKSVQNALEEFSPSKEFLDQVIIRGAIK